MLGLLSSQLAFSAATTLAKKTFEFSITSSLKGLSDVIRERFSHSQVLQETQAELEAKVKMLCLPVDLLAHFATRGNTALQEPLGVALGALEEVEAFRQALVQHDVARAQDGSSPDAATASAAQLCKRLRELIARLDSLLPYLNLAISTAVLLSQGNPSPVSYSRLMAASWHLRASPEPGAAAFSLPEASWHEERRLTAAGPRMGEAFRRCRLTVCRHGDGLAEFEGAPASPLHSRQQRQRQGARLGMTCSLSRTWMMGCIMSLASRQRRCECRWQTLWGWSGRPRRAWARERTSTGPPSCCTSGRAAAQQSPGQRHPRRRPQLEPRRRMAKIGRAHV